MLRFVAAGGLVVGVIAFANAGTVQFRASPATAAVPGLAGTSPLAAAGWVVSDLGAAGARSTTAVDINEHGHVVGTIHSGRRGWRASLWVGGRWRSLGTLDMGGGLDMPNVSEAVGMNDRGQVIGTSYVDENDPRFSAFLWSVGRLNRLRCPASVPVGVPSAINGRGQVVGRCGEGQPGRDLPSRAVMWQDGKRRELGALGAGSVASAINDQGQIVGTSGRHAFLWQNGRMINLGALRGADRTSAVAINERGQIVGTSGRHAFLWQNGKMIDLGALRGWRFSEAVGINDRGQVIGLSFSSFDARVAGAYHAFVWQNGRIRDLGTLGGRSSGAAAINERGQIVGASTTKSGSEHAFVWQNGRMTDLGTVPHSKASGAVAMNERGQVVGSSFMRDNTRHAVLWSRR